jgi:hypothetical protein
MAIYSALPLSIRLCGNLAGADALVVTEANIQTFV